MASPGILERHSRECATKKTGDPCNCKPAIQGWAYDRRSRKKLTKNFGNAPGARAEAKRWRAQTLAKLDQGTLRAPTATTLREAWETWLAGATEGSIRTRSGDRYKPSALRGYATAMSLRVLPDLGAYKLSDLQRGDVQELVDRMLGKGLDPSTIRNTLMPLRVVFRRAVARGEIAVNPTAGLELPAVRGRRERIVAPAQAAEMIAVLPDGDRALWATALYGGLRRGELMALQWSDVDDGAGVIHVRRAWDMREGVIETKSRAGSRTVPLASILRGHLLQHRLRQGRAGEGLVFGRSVAIPFNPVSVRERALAAWRKENERRLDEWENLPAPQQSAEPELVVPIGLHECRHTFASLMIAAGVNAKALSTYMGHASITITLDRYGHLMPGNEAEAAGLLDRYLTAAASGQSGGGSRA